MGKTERKGIPKPGGRRGVWLLPFAPWNVRRAARESCSELLELRQTGAARIGTGVGQANRRDRPEAQAGARPAYSYIWAAFCILVAIVIPGCTPQGSVVTEREKAQLLIGDALQAPVQIEGEPPGLVWVEEGTFPKPILTAEGLKTEQGKYMYPDTPDEITVRLRTSDGKEWIAKWEAG
jgi:hypothetical protein